MKKLMTIALIGIVLTGGVSCQKNNKSPQPQAPPTNSTPNNPNSIAMSHQDSMICQYWELRKDEYYYNGNLLTTTLHNDSINCFIHLKCDEVQVGAASAYRKANNGIDCIPETGQWKISNGKLELAILYTIKTLKTDSLILQMGSTGTQGHIYYFVK